MAVGTQEASEPDTEIWSMYGACVFAPCSNCLHSGPLLTFESIWHPMKQLFSSLQMKTARLYKHTNFTTLPHLAQHTITLLIWWYIIFLQIVLDMDATLLWRSSGISFILKHPNLEKQGTVEFLGKQLQVLKEWINILCLHFWKNWAIKLPEVTFKNIPSMFRNSCYVPLQSSTICF